MPRPFPSSNLKPISILVDARERKLNACIENLRIVDIRTTKDFERIRNTIRQTVLLKPIIFDKPQLINHSLKANAGLLLGLIHSIKELFIQQIAFPFTGTDELFDYISESTYYTGSEPHLLRKGNCLIITIRGLFLSKEKTLMEAQSRLSLTMQLVTGNNIVAEGWSRRAKVKLDRWLELKREELFRLYGLPG